MSGAQGLDWPTNGAPRGAINGWHCPACNKHTYAIHVHEGVTPMFMPCRATDLCKGVAVSLNYPNDAPLPHVIEAVAWEWYKPSRRAYRKLTPQAKDHVDLGGLLLRELTFLGRHLLP